MKYFDDDPEPEEDEPFTPYEERAALDEPHCNACLRPQMLDCELRRAAGDPAAGFKLCLHHGLILQSSDWVATCTPIGELNV